MAQQTAVDYLISELRSSVLHKNEIRLIRPYINHAKKMEKEQIEKAYQQGALDGYEPNYGSGEQYYNETYGKSNGS